MQIEIQPELKVERFTGRGRNRIRQRPDSALSLLGGLVSGTQDHIAIKDLTGRFIYVNPACAEWFGMTVESIVGRTNTELFGEVEAEAVAARDRLLLESGHRVEYEEVLSRDGVIRTWLTTKDVVRDATGAVIGYGSISREITARVEAEAALLRSEETLRQSMVLLNGLLEGTSDHISVKDLQGRYVVVNRACAEWYGVASETMLGRTYADLYGPEQADLVAERDRQLIESGAPIAYEETVTWRGVTRTWLTTKDVIRDAAGLIVAQFAFSRDITEFKRAGEQSVQSQKMESLGRLAGGIAHDFNNLLTIIAGNTQFLLADLVDHPGRAAAEEIATAADRAAAVTRQLLAFSRQQVLDPQIVDVHVVIAEIEPLIRRLAGDEIEVAIETAKSVGYVRIDRSQLEQAVLNLAINARDAMAAGGRLVISVADVEIAEEDVSARVDAVAGQYVEVLVADTGHGIDAGVLGHIYEPFFTTKPPGSGTGLGLSMVDGVVRQSGGYLEVDSQPDIGTTFRVYLPRVPPPVPPSSAEPSAGGLPPASDGAGHELVLLVEDEPGVREIARRTLAEAGYEVLEASGLAAASEIISISACDIDLLVTDVMMPGGSGTEVASRLLAANAQAAVLYMSGYTDDVISHQGVLEPGVRLIAKPFTAEGLRAAVRDTLNRA